MVAIVISISIGLFALVYFALTILASLTTQTAHIAPQYPPSMARFPLLLPSLVPEASSWLPDAI
jgi:hypothetical protein